jgi:periplasmic protein TonB
VQSATTAPQAEPQKPQAEPQKPQAEPQKPQAEPPTPAPTPPLKPSPLAKPSPKAPSKAVAPSTPQKSSPTPSPAPSAEPAPSAPPTAAPAPGPVAKADPQPGTQAPAPSADDAGSLAQYRMQLIGVAKRYKRYPRVAMDNNWEGDVVVRMVIGANGMIASVTIKTTSGHEILDKQAIEMFTKAKPLVPIPGALRGKEFVIEVRAIYNLKEPDSG